VTRHQRMKRTMRSPARQKKKRKRERGLERELIRHMIELYKHDARLVPPHWLWNEIYGQTVLDPCTRFVVAGGLDMDERRGSPW
jgi:hypothetical protein